MTRQKLVPIALHALAILAELHRKRALEEHLRRNDEAGEQNRDADKNADDKAECCAVGC